MTQADVSSGEEAEHEAEMVSPLTGPPAVFASHSSTSPPYPSPFSHTEAKSNSNISDHKLLLACLLSCDEGLDCVWECFKELTPPASQQTAPESLASFAARYA